MEEVDLSSTTPCQWRVMRNLLFANLYCYFNYFSNLPSSLGSDTRTIAFHSSVRDCFSCSIKRMCSTFRACNKMTGSSYAYLLDSSLLFLCYLWFWPRLLRGSVSAFCQYLTIFTYLGIGQLVKSLDLRSKGSSRVFFCGMSLSLQIASTASEHHRENNGVSTSE